VITPADSPALATLGRLSADLAAGAGSATLMERLVDDLARPFRLDFSVRYQLAPAERALTLHSTTGVASRFLPALKTVRLGEAVCGSVAEQRRPQAHSRVDADPDERLSLARELDATAYASFPLTAGPTLLGTLSVGSRTRPEFGRHELTVLGLAADLVTVAAARERDSAVLDAALAGRSAAEQQTAHLATALVTNRTIAMAIGIVMARTGRTDEQARAWLADASQRSNRKMRALAEQIVLTGSIEL
jgi:transcriptional regulator with GAF, ATPase, and Fis domain